MFTIFGTLISVSRFQQSGLEYARGLSTSVCPGFLSSLDARLSWEWTNQGILIGTKQAELLIPNGRTLNFQLYDNIPKHASQQYFYILFSHSCYVAGKYLWVFDSFELNWMLMFVYNDFINLTNFIENFI